MKEVRFIDLSHTIEEGMITYPGLPGPSICDFLSREASRAHFTDGATFQISRIDMVANTGTYIDAPFHRFEGMEDISQLSLENIADVPGIVFQAPPGKSAIGPELFEGQDLEGKAVLVKTDWDRHWGNDQYFKGSPFLTREAAAFLVKARPALVGIDSLNIDDIEDGRRPVHSQLLGAGIPIVEHMTNLGKLPVLGFRFSGVPAPVKGMGTFPIRAFAVLGSKRK